MNHLFKLKYTKILVFLASLYASLIPGKTLSNKGSISSAAKSIYLPSSFNTATFLSICYTTLSIILSYL